MGPKVGHYIGCILLAPTTSQYPFPGSLEAGGACITLALVSIGGPHRLSPVRCRRHQGARSSNGCGGRPSPPVCQHVPPVPKPIGDVPKPVHPARDAFSETEYSYGPSDRVSKPCTYPVAVGRPECRFGSHPALSRGPDLEPYGVPWGRLVSWYPLGRLVGRGFSLKANASPHGSMSAVGAPYSP